MQAVGNSLQVLVIHGSFVRPGPEVEQQQAHNNDNCHSTQEKDSDIGDHVHDCLLFLVTIGVVYEHLPAGTIRKNLNMGGKIPKFVRGASGTGKAAQGA